MKAITRKLLSVCAAFMAVVLCLWGIGSTMPIYVRADETYSNMTDTDLQEFADQVVALVNQERAAEGLNPLYAVPLLHEVSAVRAEECVTSFSHTRPNGTSCGTILDEYNISWFHRGENIAYGYRTPESVMNDWMNSDGHRANILGESFTHMGVGVFLSGSTYYWTQTFVGGTNATDGAYMPQLKTTMTSAFTTTITTPMLTTSNTTASLVGTEPFDYESTIYTGGEQIMISSDEMKYYRFVPTVSGTYHFYTTGSMDTYGRLFDSSGEELTHNDDSSSSLNFSFSETLSAYEEYYIGVKSYSGSGYALLYVEAPAETTTTVTTTVTEQSGFDYEYTISTGGEQIYISSDGMKYYRFVPDVSSTYRFYTTGSLDTVGILYDSYRYELNSDDDSGSDMNFSFTETLSAYEEYYIAVKSYSDSGYVFLYAEDIASETTTPTYTTEDYTRVTTATTTTTTTSSCATEDIAETTTTTMDVSDYDIVAQLPAMVLRLDQLAENDYQVSVPIRLSKNKGFQNLGFGLSYPADTLTPTSIQCDSSDLIAASTVSPDGGFLWLGFISKQSDVSGNYVDYCGDSLCTITFTVSPDVQPGDVLGILFSYTDAQGEPCKAINAAQQELQLYCAQEGELHIYDDLISTTQSRGDLNNDGVISLADVVLLNRFLNESVVLNAGSLAAADVDHDGFVDSHDSILLLQFLSKIITSL